MHKKLNQVERDIVEKKLSDSYDYIRSQNSIKKELRDIPGIKKATQVRDTMNKWLKEDDAIKGPTPERKSAGTMLFENLCESMQAVQNGI